MKVLSLRDLNKVLNDRKNGIVSKSLPHVVLVGYTQKYAIFVHENMNAYHEAGKQAKFLERPARANRQAYVKLIAKFMQQGNVPFQKALLMVGMRLQRDSQMIVPIDTGALRASAFTCY